MLNRTTKAAGLLVVCCTLVACGNNAPPGSSSELDAEGLASASLQADFDAFSKSAKLDPAQRAALLKHFQRFEKHYASLARTGKTDVIDRLLEHDRTLALSELRADQAKLYDAAPLPGSKAFTPASLQVAGGAQ
ncbi:MAG TPA: hypothetical protein VHP33_15405 [Polyangiaceae bacterium]|nr:hypothetical protein [Polyangiaceae bacterium]